MPILHAEGLLECRARSVDGDGRHNSLRFARAFGKLGSIVVDSRQHFADCPGMLDGYFLARFRRVDLLEG
jgi:hypothetical protein